MQSSYVAAFINATVSMAIAIVFFIPVYISLLELPDGKVMHKEETSKERDGSNTNAQTFLQQPPILIAGKGSREDEAERLTQAFLDVQVTCDQLGLPGSPHHVMTEMVKIYDGNRMFALMGSTVCKNITVWCMRSG
ncbi:uncharacterized protein LOC124434292 isoform X2 [Xenia sp. Carnegie-2017]|nr:uncharacterized protein LOC124434292 isoform X2 [Xenia sp. Carnegie-2017]